MIVLGVDTSSDVAAVGLYKDGALLCESTINNGKNHSLTLLPVVENMLNEVGVSFSDIDVYTCGIGPGSFTGVRIGAATIKGFAQAQNKPCVAVSSLGVLAENIREFSGLRVAAMHARVDELFCAVYDADGGEVLAPSVMTVAELVAFLEGKTCRIIGSGALQFAEEFKQALGEDVVPKTGWVHLIRGGAVAELGYLLAEAGQTIPCEDVAPAYLRVSQAEREYAEKHKQSQ